MGTVPREPASLNDGHIRERGIAEMIILTGLSSSTEHVQIQALEVRLPAMGLIWPWLTLPQLLRTNRIFTHTAIYAAPRTFLVLFVKSTTDGPFVHHLNNLIFISHYHNIEDGFANLEESSEWIEDGQASLLSAGHRSVVPEAAFQSESPFFPQDVSAILRQ